MTFITLPNLIARCLLAIGMVGCTCLITNCNKEEPILPTVRIGHFSNVTHPQALIARQLSRQNRGWFESRIGMKVDWYQFATGSSAVEAMFSKSVDVTYIGPGPMLIAYTKSHEQEMRLLSGAVQGGSALVLRKGLNIKEIKDFKGKKIASPQLANTQDIQLRKFFLNQGLKLTLTGGDVTIIPTNHADQLALFEKGILDGSWTIEPWLTRLELTQGAHIYHENKQDVVTLLVGRTAFCNKRPELVKKIIQAHCELTDWILAHPHEAKQLIRAELKELLGKEPSQEMINRSFARITPTHALNLDFIQTTLQDYVDLGFLNTQADLQALYTYYHE